MLSLSAFDLQTISPEELGEILITAKKAYYTSGNPTMDDHTYDTLEEILRQKTPHHRLFSKAGHDNFDTGWEKKKHTIPMGSQNKVNTFADLVHYFDLKKVPLFKGDDPQGQGVLIQPKCDGISVEIEYKNGVLVDATTRGDGIEGDLITQNVVKMKNFVANPTLSSAEGFTGSVRCEIVVTKKDFEKLNVIAGRSSDEAISNGIATAKGLAMTYSNPRNAASGLSQRLDSKYSEYCSLYAVDVIARSESTKQSLQTEQQKIEILNKLGFVTVESSLCHSFEEIQKIYQEFFDTKRLAYPYEIDGLVIKVNNLDIAQKLGSQNNRPKYQVAYKFPASTNSTQIKAVTWQVGPLGNITPVAEVEPIELSGAIITYASLANYDLIKNMDLNIGDIVKISRRGDVIPHIESVITKVAPGHVQPPVFCSSCQSKLVVEEKFLRCPNSTNCLSQILGSLRLFCDTLGILGLSDKTISKLYLASRVRLPGDFFKLQVSDIQDLDNLGEKSAKNIIHQIQSKKSLSLVEVFDASIIPNFSAKRIQQLVNAGYDTAQKMLDIQVTDFDSVFGFQITLATKIVEGIKLRRPWIESILSQVNLQTPTSSGDSLLGLSFAITGDLKQPRKQLEKTITDHQGQIHSGVSKNTSYLITNETESSSAKFVTAKKLGTKIISENEFSSLI
jgi:DNA ligase (NAD+)